MPQGGQSYNDQKGDTGRLPDGTRVVFDGQQWIPLDFPSSQDRSTAEGGGRLERAGAAITGTGSTIADVLKGVLKEGGSLAEGIRSVPGRVAAGAMGEPFVSADTSALEPTNTAQRVGQVGTQLAEFLSPLPGGKIRAGTRMAANITPQIARLVELLKDPRLANNPQARMAVQTALRKLTVSPTSELARRTVLEGGRAAAVSGLHGEETPEVEGGIAATSPLLQRGTETALQSPLVQQLLAILGAGAPAGLKTTGLAARMGTFGVIKRLLADLLAKPGAQRRIVLGVGTVPRGAAAAVDLAQQQDQDR